MKGKKYSTEEKIRILRQADGGRSILEVCRKAGSDVPPVEKSVWADGGQGRKKVISPEQRRRAARAVVAGQLCSGRAACRFLKVSRSTYWIGRKS
jgi:hypothetical protein